MEINRKKLRLGDVLVNSGVITEADLEKGLARQKGTGRKLGEVLVDEGLVTEENIAKALSSQLRYDMVELQNIEIDEEVLKLVPVNVLKKYKCLPFEYSQDTMMLRVAMADPMDMAALDDINIITNMDSTTFYSTSSNSTTTSN